MNIGFLIITYGNNHLDNCINSIRMFYNFPIYIVDNNIIGNNNNINLYNNLIEKIYYIKNIENNFELGAIWYACKAFPDIDKFIILHNSMVLIDKLPIELEKCNFMSFWKTLSSDYSPVVNWVKEKLKEININMEHDKIWYSITGCCCIIDTIYIKKLISLNYDKLYGTNKFCAVGTEILFGYLISNVLGITNISLFQHTLDDNVTGKISYKYIKKIASGQGGVSSINQYINLSDFKMFDKIFNLNLKNNMDLNECYINILNEIDKDENIDIQNFLLKTNNATLNYPNVQFSVILSIRHRMFTKLFFPTYYQIEKQMILSGNKKLF